MCARPDDSDYTVESDVGDTRGLFDDDVEGKQDDIGLLSASAPETEEEEEGEVEERFVLNDDRNGTTRQLDGDAGAPKRVLLPKKTLATEEVGPAKKVSSKKSMYVYQYQQK